MGKHIIQIAVFFYIILLAISNYGQVTKTGIKLTPEITTSHKKSIDTSTNRTNTVYLTRSNNTSEKAVDNNTWWTNPILISFLTFIIGLAVNITLAQSLRKSNEKNLQKQIDNSKEINLTQFKATISSKNRQEWINDLRHTISDLISYSTALMIEMNTTSINKENMKQLIQKMYFNKSKISMLLNDSKEDHIILLEHVNNLVKACVDTKSERSIVSKKVETETNEIEILAKTIFKKQWEKIKKLN